MATAKTKAILEPQFTEEQYEEIRANKNHWLTKTFNWYTSNFPNDTAHNWLVKRFPKAKGMWCPTGGWLCRMMERGFPEDVAMPWLEKEVNAYVAEQEKAKKEKAVAKEKIIHPDNKDLFGNIRDRELDDVLANIDYAIDDIICKKKPAPVAINKMMKKGQLDSIRKYVESNIEEFTGANKKEGYEYLTKTMENQMVKMLKSIITQLDDAKIVHAKMKKATVARKKSPANLTKQVKDYTVVAWNNHKSVRPETVIGAKSAFIYDGATRRVSYFQAVDGGVLSIRGKSVVDYDETMSTSKILRKPDEQLKTLIEKGTKKSMMSFYDAIKTSASAPKVRCSEATTIIKVFG